MLNRRLTIAAVLAFAAFWQIVQGMTPAPTGPTVDHVGRLERNHYFNSDGQENFVQLVGWDYHEAESTWHVVFWRLVREQPMTAERDWRNGGYVVRFDDSGVWREVRAASFDESWTQEGFAGDPELLDREAWPKEKRRELTRAGH